MEQIVDKKSRKKWLINYKREKLIIFGIVLIILCAIPFIINGYLKSSIDNKIINYDEAIKMDDIDAIIILGCKVNPNGPSLMLKNRLDMGIKLFKDMETKLVLSGDHGKKEYDEVNTMRDYVIKNDISTSDIFMDHAGFSTYDSIYRAKEVFGIKKMIIVTQEYHLYRALYIAKKLDVEAYGVKAHDIPYPSINRKNVIREFLARNKDYFKTIIKPSSKYLGEIIDINGDGNLTLD